MGGGLMQLVAYGAQDVYLSGNPQITFFKVVYRRHTNFSVEPIQQVWNGAADFGRTVTCNINRNGDLISNMYVAVNLNEKTPGSTAWGYVSRLGHAMIRETKIEIGGSKIDEQYGDWLNIWYELTHKVGQERGYAKMIGDVENLTNVSTDVKRAYQLYVPLQFWFNRNNGLALPLIALQYHDVRVTVDFRSAAELVNFEGTTIPNSAELPSMADCYLLIDYIYLDSEERKRFAQASHEYLIEQLQFTGSETLNGSNQKYRLNFNHPSKYLIWAPQLERYATRNQWAAVAFNGDWEAARNRFAKIIALAASTPTFNTTGTPNTALNITLVAAPTVGDLVQATIASPTGSGITTAMLNKVDVRFVAQTAANTCQVATGATSRALAQDLLDNSIVTRNTLTMEDISTTLTQLIGTSTDTVRSVLNLFAISAINYHNYGNFIDGSDNPVYEAKLQLNGHDRFQERDGNYFNYVQPYQHFPNTPADGINVYSFALKGEEHQPQGTCNFSRIDNATLQIRCGLYNTGNDNGYVSNMLGGASSNSTVNIYTVNYNVLRMMSGMAGTAYSN
jgi:hypothetical protein